MNDSSLPPELGGQATTGVETAGTAHAAGAAQAGASAQPASGNESMHAAGSASHHATSAKPHRRLWPFALSGLAAVLLIVGIVPRLHASAALTEQTQAQSMLSVSVVAPRPAPAVNELLLPGAVTPFAEAS
ncbi:efflux transporter periplasmic adaptor subunit, partial [Paraburkholderia sediminicola]